MTEEITLTEQKRREYEQTLNALIATARQDGFVLTINVEGLKPPAMGNYYLVGEARLAKELYR